MMKLFSLIAALTMGFTASAQGVPNTFSAGDTVSASKINQNFSYLDGKGKRLVLKNNGEFVGTIIPLLNTTISSNGAFVVTSKGYYAHLNGFLGMNNYLDISSTIEGVNVYFENTCQPQGGNIYLINAGARRIYKDLQRGVVYVPAQPEISSIGSTSIAYKWINNGCQSTAGHSGQVVKVLANDPTVTGWPNSFGTLTIDYE